MTEITLPNTYERNEPSIELQIQNLYKVKRKGDKIYYTKPENITNIQNSAPKVIKNSQDLKNSHKYVAENVVSEESLCKTFSFEENDKETERCVAFWRHVVEKNLEPMKCTIIELLKEQQATVTKTQVPDIKKSVGKSKATKKKIKCNKTQQKEEESKKLKKTEETSKWVAILKDLQKKRLNEIRLIAKKRCSFCETLSADMDDHKKELSKEIKQELQELDEFEPKYDLNNKMNTADELATKFLKIKSLRTSKQIENLKEKPNSEGFESSITDEQVEKSNEPLQKAKLTDSQLELIKKESQKYGLVDTIGQKEKLGSYSEWRKNNTKEACRCALEYCKCNSSPYVKSFEPGHYSKKDSFETTKDITSNDNQDKEKEKIPNNAIQKSEHLIKRSITFENKVEMQDSIILSPDTHNDTISNDEPEWVEPEDRTYPLSPKESLKIRKAFSIVIDCICGMDDCDCKSIIERRTKREKPDPSSDILDLPKPSAEVRRKSSIGILGRKDSLELIYKQVSFLGEKLDKLKSSDNTDLFFEKENDIENSDSSSS